MRYLLDTHVFLWMAAAPDQLSTRIRELVRQKSNRLHLSAASGWEIALLQNLGRIKLPDVPRRFIPEAIQHLQIVPLPIGFSTAIAAAELPLIHRDPFDRIIIAEAVKENMIVLTKDNQFKNYDVQTAW